MKGGELLITVVGNPGQCAIVPSSLAGFNVARAISVARINEKADKRYVRYCFQSDDLSFQIYGGTNDTVQPTLNLSSLKSLRLSFPELSEQRAIADVLSSLDDKIDLLHRQNKTLEAMAETLFRQWFTEEAKDDWKEGLLGDPFELQRGFDLPAQNRVPGDYPIYAASGYSGTHVEGKITAPGVTTGRSGLLGKVFFIQDDFWPLNTSLFIKRGCDPRSAPVIGSDWGL